MSGDEAERKRSSYEWRGLNKATKASKGIADSMNQVVYQPKGKMPPMYDIVLMDNPKVADNIYIAVLMQYLNMTALAANEVMTRLRQNGQIVCGVYTREVAEVKVVNIVNFAYGHNQQIKCIMRHNKKHVKEKP
jgi:ATP-dependent Clp protease adaptor protein ClpS